ncbi:CHRD domain-containing protein [Corallococcus carmarthensis]|uniref:CHRD domain-containing protein n=1 Tax=Corallococcus carmarthensis TaxID=2316728 RepID=A0A3A8KHV0_9BACT|nr:CHRD domain-containing protein [Corallococcus carmarthensis]RKH06669.1 CHRD domain-containing protein [Corallococcus carmarthensis]
MRKPLPLALATALFTLSAHAGDPSLGATTYTVYEAFLSPAQQPGEESETPKLLQKSLGATAPSTPREQRKSRGHGQLRFTKDLTRAYVDVQMTGVNPEDILMFHIHCGPPGVLGPIIVDLGEAGALSKTVVDGRFTLELKNENITFIKDMKGMKSGLPESCPAELGFLPTQTKTLAGLESLARKGVLYFNLHTKAHTYYGEMRGQLYAAQP